MQISTRSLEAGGAKMRIHCSCGQDFYCACDQNAHKALVSSGDPDVMKRHKTVCSLCKEPMGLPATENVGEVFWKEYRIVGIICKKCKKDQENC